MNAPSLPPLARPDEDLLVGAPPALDTDSLDAPTRRMAVAMTLIFWLANISVQMYRGYLDGHADMNGLLLARLATAGGGLALCFLIHLVITRLGHRPFATRAVALVLIVPFAADACAWISYLSFATFSPAALGTSPSTSSATIQAVLYWFWFMLAWAALYLALRYSYEVKASERRARIVEGLAHRAQLRALQNQISPHFMFNTLNSISALMLDGKAERAEAMLRRLSDFLRATLSLDALSDISLEKELEIQRMYLAIERERFPDMTLEVDCADELGDALVPALITQPVVENAVKYGVAASLEPTRIGITARDRAGRLVVAIENDSKGGDRPPAGGLGVGLRNVRDRLRSRFGEADGFVAEAKPLGGFRVELTMPLRRKQG